MPGRGHIRFEDEDLPLSKKDQISEEIASAGNLSSITHPNRKRKRRPENHHLANGVIGKNANTQETTHSIRSDSSRKNFSTFTEKRNALLPMRRALPISRHKISIQQALHDKDVLLLVGETGSGKSTQVPQFLMHESWCSRCIAITQPRRVAAISLAKRVAEEMGTPLGSGSPASKVGYSVRFDTSTSPSTRIKFLTEGMLLQEMLRDPWLKQYSAVIIDEVHERSVNTDILLGFMRNLVTADNKSRNGEAFKVVVMSATAETERIFHFFDQGFRKGVDKKVSVEDCYSESSWSGLSSSDEDQCTVKLKSIKFQPNHTANGIPQGIDGHGNLDTQGTKELPLRARQELLKKSDETKAAIIRDEVDLRDGHKDLESRHISSLFIEGRQHPVKIMYLPEPTADWLEAALKAILQIHAKEPLPGDILVFLTGQDTIETMEQTLNEYVRNFSEELPRVLVLPLFAALPQPVQQKVFLKTPPGTRKVILSTNIAETSVTVPGVRFVIDCGRVKVKQFNNKLGLDSLLSKPISKSAAIQRQGRAGREAPGVCYRLYSEKDYIQLEKSAAPEILRCELSSAVLTMKARGIEDIFGFPLLDPPPREAIEKALFQLYQIGALTDTGHISEIGSKMAKLPLSPMLGRALVEGSLPERDCLSDLIDIVACLSVESIFLTLNSEEKKEQAEEARKSLFRREGDHMTLLATVDAYLAEPTDRREWAERHFISHRAMQRAMDIRKQLRKVLHYSESTSPEHRSPETRTEIIMQCLLRGFAPLTAVLVPDGSYKTCYGHQTVAIHPSSVLFGKKVEAIMFTEWVFTNKSYARGVSAVQLQWVEQALAARA